MNASPGIALEALALLLVNSCYALNDSKSPFTAIAMHACHHGNFMSAIHQMQHIRSYPSRGQSCCSLALMICDIRPLERHCCHMECNLAFSDLTAMTWMPLSFTDLDAVPESYSWA